MDTENLNSKIRYQLQLFEKYERKEEELHTGRKAKGVRSKLRD